MATYEGLGRYRGNLDALSAAARIDLDRLFARRGDFTDAAAYRAFLTEHIPYLSARYENAAGALAALRYDGWREGVLDGGAGPFSASPAKPDLESARRSAYGLSHPLKEAGLGRMAEAEALEATLSRYEAMLDRRIRTAARNTMRQNSARDKAGLGCACVPRGATTCPFCLEMAAVGVAWSFAVLDIEGRGFHDHCQCDFVPGFIGHDVEVDSYDPDAIRNALWDARETIGLPQSYFRMTPAQERALREELERRDPRWVMEGVVPEVTTEENRLVRQHEYETASRMSQHGYKAHFQVDELRYYDAVSGMAKTRGLPDLDGGIELKSISSDAVSVKTVVDSGIRNARDKQSTSMLVIDNTNSPFPDDLVVRHILQNDRTISFPVYLVGKDKSLLLVK